MRNRIDLAKKFAEMGFTKGAEIGVYLGYYSRVLLDNIPNLELSCIDSWDRNETRKRAYEETKEMLSKYPGSTVIKANSVDAAKDVANESLDFVFIDASHYYEDVRDDLNAWFPKVRSGGIVSGHDYYESPRRSVEVIQAVDEFVEKNNIELHIIPWDKENPHRDNRQPCWWFVKP